MNRKLFYFFGFMTTVAVWPVWCKARAASVLFRHLVLSDGNRPMGLFLLFLVWNACMVLFNRRALREIHLGSYLMATGVLTLRIAADSDVLGWVLYLGLFLHLMGTMLVLKSAPTMIPEQEASLIVIFLAALVISFISYLGGISLIDIGLRMLFQVPF